MNQPLTERCISDFGEQWTKFRENTGYYASVDLLRDLFEPLLTVDRLRGTSVAEIGSGTGRVVNMLLDAGCSNVTALEPSAAFDVLRENTRPRSSQVTLLQLRGDELPQTKKFDYVFSVGVLHHIPEPGPVVKAAFQSLRSGGQIGIWLYGKEGNGLYLAIFGPVRRITKHLPDFLLQGIVWALWLGLHPYAFLCRFLPLPMRGYVRQVIGKFNAGNQRLVIFDQLNPTYAKYYTKQEATDLLAQAGFQNIRLKHRHGYSWTVVGDRP